MSKLNVLPSDRVAVAATVDPDVLTATTHDSGWVSMADFGSIMAIVAVGTLGSSATVDAILQQATDGSGTGAKAITGKAITQLTDAGSDSDKQAIINCYEDELDVENDFTHVRLRITVATASSDGGGVILGLDPAVGVASDSDLSTVDEIV